MYPHLLRGDSHVETGESVTPGADGSTLEFGALDTPLEVSGIMDIIGACCSYTALLSHDQAQSMRRSNAPQAARNTNRPVAIAGQQRHKLPSWLRRAIRLDCWLRVSADLAGTAPTLPSWCVIHKRFDMSQAEFIKRWCLNNVLAEPSSDADGSAVVAVVRVHVPPLAAVTVPVAL
jgi:hypothetical protein